MGVWVNGIYFDAPGVKTVVNDANFQAAPNVGGLGVLFLGPSNDGQPNTVLGPFATPNDAKAALKGGDLLQGILNAFLGATLAGRPASFSVINVSPLTAGTSAINSAGAVAQIALATVQYGLPANSNKWMVQAGTTAGYKVSQASDYVGPGGATYPPDSTDNVALPGITLYYNGTGSSPTFTVSDSQLVLAATTSDTGGTIALSAGMTVQQLVNQINQLPGWNATVADPNPNDTVAAFFDNFSTPTTVSTLSTAPTTLYANVLAVVRYFNSRNLYFTATRSANATSLATSSTWTYATGGTAPSAANSDWQNAYTTAQSATGITFVQPVTSAQTIWAMNDAHCKYMAGIGIPRRGYLGDALLQTLATEITAEAALNSDRSTIVWPEQKGSDYNGASTTFAPYLVACAIVGERAATPAYNALTQQPVPSSGMGQTVTPGQVSQGLAAGIAVIAPNQSGTVVLQQDRTTWMQSTAFDKVENSTGLCVDIVTQDLNATLQQFIGKPTPLGVAVTALFARLKYWYKQGYIVAAPARSDIQLTKPAADQIAGNYQAAFAVPTNYIGMQLVPVAVAA